MVRYDGFYIGRVVFSMTSQTADEDVLFVVDLENEQPTITVDTNDTAFTFALVKGESMRSVDYWTKKTEPHIPVVKALSVINDNIVLWLPSLHELLKTTQNMRG